jgi:hypothetical protein
MAKTMNAASPQVMAQPGGWARAVLAGVSSMMSGLGDASAVGQIPSGGGALTGIARTMNAQNQRVAQEKQANSAEQSAQLQRAETTQRIMMNTRNIYRADQEDRAANYKMNDEYMKTFDKTHDSQEMNQDQLTDALKKDPKFWLTHTGRPTSEVPVMEGDHQKIGADGKPAFAPMYTIASTTARDGSEGRWETTAAQSKLYKLGGNDIPEGSIMNTENRDSAQAAGMAVHQVNMIDEKANEEETSAEQAAQLSVVNQNPSIQRYKAMVVNQPLAGLNQAKDNTQAHIASIDQMIAQGQQRGSDPTAQSAIQALQQKKQEMIQEGQNIDKAIGGFNQKAQDSYSKWQDDAVKRQDDQAKQAEVVRHDKAEEYGKDMDRKVKSGDFLGDPNAKSPQEFLQSLDPKSRALVQMIGEGRAPLNNPGYLLAKKPEIMEAVGIGYPVVRDGSGDIVSGFDASKIKGYAETYIDFTKGKTSVALNAGGTALGHLRELKALNTAASVIPGTTAYARYQNKAQTVSSELAKFYGTDNIPGVEAIRSSLAAIGAPNRDAAIGTQAQSMGDKLDSFATTWKNAAPSREYQQNMPDISIQAKQARASLDPEYARQHPEFGGAQKAAPATQAAPAASQAPQGATHQYRDKQGNISGYAVNGKFVPAGQ